MSKLKSKMYAKALVSLILDEKNLGNEKKIIDNFIKLLQKNGDTKRIEEIISLAENLFSKRTGKRKVILEMARKIDTKNLVKQFLKEGDLLEEKINTELIAGIKIIVNNNQQLDFSLQKKLQEIF